MESVYVLISLKDKEFYTGLSNNVPKRFHQHNKGLVRSTKSRRPFILFRTEAFETRKEAEEREKFLKSGVGRKYLKQLLQKSRNGGIGRRAGLKIQFPLKECRFDSDFRHMIK
jgi:putative endonuclease